MKIAIGSLIAVVIIVGAALAIKSAIGKAAWEKIENAPVATVNGEVITKKELDIAKENNKLKGINMGDQEVLSRMTVQKAIYLEAVKQGKMELDKVALKKNLTALKDKLLKNGKYEMLKSDLKALGISEKDYWESETKRMTENGTRDFVKQTLKKQFIKNSDPSEKATIEAKFNDYYNQVTAAAINASEIKILIEVK